MNRQNRITLVEWLESEAEKGNVTWLGRVHDFAYQCQNAARHIVGEDEEIDGPSMTLEEAREEMKAGGDTDFYLRYRMAVLQEVTFAELEVGQQFTLAAGSADRYAATYTKLSLPNTAMKGHMGQCVTFANDTPVIAT
jgi:hypothetical protein